MYDIKDKDGNIIKTFETFTDEKGLWIIDGVANMLVEPSVVFEESRQQAETERIFLESLIPSQEEIFDAELTLKSIEILTDLGVI